MRRSETSIMTKRLWLRQIDETDGEAIVNIRSDENTYKYFRIPEKISIEHHNTWYKETYCLNSDRIDWIAINDETGEFIGVYGAKKLNDGTAEISYITNPIYKHHGYASEAVNAIINWCMTTWEIIYFIVTVHIENIDSICFAKSIGFVDEQIEAINSDNFITMHRVIFNKSH